MLSIESWNTTFSNREHMSLFQNTKFHLFSSLSSLACNDSLFNPRPPSTRLPPFLFTSVHYRLSPRHHCTTLVLHISTLCPDLSRFPIYTIVVFLGKWEGSIRRWVNRKALMGKICREGNGGQKRRKTRQHDIHAVRSATWPFTKCPSSTPAKSTSKRWVASYYRIQKW